jgi:hypothetical protein
MRPKEMRLKMKHRQAVAAVVAVVALDSPSRRRGDTYRLSRTPESPSCMPDHFQMHRI